MSSLMLCVSKQNIPKKFMLILFAVEKMYGSKNIFHTTSRPDENSISQTDKPGCNTKEQGPNFVGTKYKFSAPLPF